MQRVNPNEILSELSPLLKRIAGPDITLAAVLDDDVVEVRADAADIGQLLLNLVTNARDAMPQGGTISIETRKVLLAHDDESAGSGLPSEPWLRLTVSDTGRGLDDATKARLFEPFFTTKPADTGAGLGLAAVQGIVRRLEGRIAVESTPGEGSTFTIHLPACASALSSASSHIDAEPPRRSAATILIVEDEHRVRILVKMVLEAQGYRILVAEDGEEAVRLAQEYAGPIHLLLTDIVMPGMNGREVYQAISREREDIKVAYMSGYTDGVILECGIHKAGVTFLQKPFGPLDLLASIRGLLNRAREAA